MSARDGPVTAQRASRIAGGLAFVAGLSVVGAVAWSLLTPSYPGPALPLAEGPALGDVTGYVGRVDPSARTVDVADNLFGLRPVMMVLTDDTSIMVGGKQGAIGDLSKDTPVRAFYEVRNDIKYVTSILVITDQARSQTGASSVDSRPAADTRPAIDSRPAAAVTPPVESRPLTPPAVASAPPASRSAAGAPVMATITSRPVPASPRASAPPVAAAVGSRPVTGVRAAEPDAGDGSAAIDWLFESRRR